MLAPRQGKRTVLVGLSIWIIGYLIGSVSPARLIARRVDPDADVTTYAQPIEGTDEVYHDTAASATLVNLKVGWQYGCLTSIIDMLKAVVPMLIVRWMLPDTPYDFVIAFGVLVGHNWPIYYKFHGGRGESVTYGSMLITDPLAPVVANVVAMVLGFAFGSVHFLRWTGIVLMVPWVWWRGNDRDVVIYLIAVAIVYLVAMRHDFVQMHGFHRRKVFASRAALTEFLDMGSGLGQAMDDYSIPALLGRLRRSGQ